MAFRDLFIKRRDEEENQCWKLQLFESGLRLRKEPGRYTEENVWMEWNRSEKSLQVSPF